MNDDPYWQSFSVDQRMDFAPLDLLAGVIAYLAVKTAPFSAAFSDWLSMTAAVGLASRPRRSRKVMCRSSQMDASKYLVFGGVSGASICFEGFCNTISIASFALGG